jgi:hypothetical protein
MTRLLSRWLAALALASAAWPAAARAQGEAPPLLPAPTAERPPAYVLPPPNPNPVPPFAGLEPLLDPPEWPLPGPFFNVDATVLALHLRNQLMNSVPIAPGQTDLVSFPGSRLDAAVSPHLELGCRIPDGWGEVYVGYRFLVSRGADHVPGPRGEDDISTRLDFNVFDLAYRSREWALGPGWDMRWTAGLRAATFYFDARRSLGPPGTSVDLLSQDETNHFYGYGIFGALEVGRELGVPGLALLGRLEGTSYYARIKQTASETFAGDVVPQQSAVRNDGAVSVPVLAEQVGLSYTPPGWPHGRLLAGYQYETWFQVGRVLSSRGQLDGQGLFLRAEFNY